jgi:hypothetical protein
MRRILTPLIVLLALPAFAQVAFKNAEMRTSLQGLRQGDEGKLVVERDTIRFLTNNGRSLSLPAAAVKKVIYSRVSGRRWKSALLPAPLFPPTLLLMFSKGRKHYLELAFDDGHDLVGAVEFKLHKSNYRGALRAVEQVTGHTAWYEQEGIKDTRQTLAAR